MKQPEIEPHSTAFYYQTTQHGIASHEATVAYTFRHITGERNPFFRSRLSYGKTVAKQLIEKGLLADSKEVLEIGGGEGQLAEELLSYVRFRRVNLGSYTMLDLNPYLLEMQRASMQSHSKRLDIHYILADALRLPLASNNVDLFIANEVIADFPVIKNLSPDDVDAFPNIPRSKYNDSDMELLAQAAELIKTYGLAMPDDGERFHLNYGAIQLLFVIHSVLRSGGAAFITEHSSEVTRTEYWDNIPGFDAPPTGIGFPAEVELDGHSEFGIKFSHLETIAEQIGFEVESGPLHEFVRLKDYNLIEFEDDVTQLNPVCTLLQFRYLILRKG